MTPLAPLPNPSTMILAAAYDTASQTLRVKFKEGSVGDYKNVPPDVANGLYASKSAGRYLLTEIKGIYDYEPVPQDAPATSEPAQQQQAAA